MNYKVFTPKIVQNSHFRLVQCFNGRNVSANSVNQILKRSFMRFYWLDISQTLNLNAKWLTFRSNLLYLTSKITKQNIMLIGRRKIAS